MVNLSIYDPSLLIDEYKSLISEQDIETNIENLNKKENSPRLRAEVYQLINNTVSAANRAKLLINLWNLAIEKNIFKAIALITKNSVMSMSPDTSLNWFILPASKALVLAGEADAAKNWIFYGTSDINERASIDINFCRQIMLLYLYDRDILDYRSETKDIKFFLNILKNDLNINEKDFFKLILTLSALGDPIPDQMWNIFFSNQDLSAESFEYIRNDTSSYFMLDKAIEKSNLAEAALISISLLQDEDRLYKDMYSFFRGLEGLVSSGLESYARKYAFEENLEFLMK
ncbi:hypothetical protein OA264_03465 [Alphaproteobacteria bacterium]|nr:hypothetical protein [Alphaproteobacteria bacterium]